MPNTNSCPCEECNTCASKATIVFSILFMLALGACMGAFVLQEAPPKLDRVSKVHHVAH